MDEVYTTIVEVYVSVPIPVAEVIEVYKVPVKDVIIIIHV